MEMKRYWIREELSFIVLPDPQFSLQAGSAATIFRLPLMYCGCAWDGAPPTPLHREDPDAVLDLFLQICVSKKGDLERRRINSDF
ncbi:hypothetical protein EJB05_35187, partial [Eragrostis curvula]